MRSRSVATLAPKRTITKGIPSVLREGPELLALPALEKRAVDDDPPSRADRGSRELAQRAA